MNTDGVTVPPAEGAGTRETPKWAIPRPYSAESAPAEEHTASAQELFRRLRDQDPQSPVRRALRDELVQRHLPLVHFLARRFRDRGEALADLVQVATIGLIKAVDRFDPERGVEFTTFATPTVVGEIKRHFRDRAWAVRVPRRLQEQKAVASRATTELFQSLGRAPTVTELAARTGLTEEQVLESLETAQAYATVSLDAGTSPGSPDLGYDLGDVDAALEKIEYRESLRPMLERLDQREKQILMLRFFAGMTQSEIAAEVGISQMHVSRLLTRTLSGLRQGLLAEE
jgi:RNA polymerase sigma-B factor